MEFRRLNRLLTLGLGAAALGRPAPSAGQEGAWRPRTVPLVGASYAPDLGLVVGVGVVHTRYAYRALPPSTRLLAEAERSEEHTSELQSQSNLVCRLLLEKKKKDSGRLSATPT